jgi:hypothetical protein
MREKPISRYCPFKRILPHLTVLNDAFEFVHDGGVNVGLFADHRVVLVVGIVGVAQLTVRPELELEKLVAELALVADVVAQVEIVGHFSVLLSAKI